MLSLLVFCIAAAAMTVMPRLLASEAAVGRPRNEGIAMVAAVLLASACGLYCYQHANPHAAPLGFAYILLVITATLYGASAARGRLKAPPILADSFVLVAACVAVYYGQAASAGIRVPFSNATLHLEAWSLPLTIAWVWLLTRMTSALNRTPRVTGGYLGIVGLTFVLLLAVGAPAVPVARSGLAFARLAAAALAGAGLASVPLALKRPGFNIGWSAALAMGFLLAQIAVGAWLQNMALAIVALLLLVFGLPLLDVSFYKMRASRRGEHVSFERNTLRLHEALARRGIAPAKILCIYLAVAAALCFLGIVLVATTTWNLVLRLTTLAALLFCDFVFFFSIVRVLMNRLPDEEIPEEIEAFGMKITPVSMSEAMDRVEAMIVARTPQHVVTTDANAILRAQADPEYAAIVRRAALATPDGYGVMWGARLLNLPIYERVTGVDMVTGICERAAQKGYSIYILGSEPGIAATAAEKLADAHPGLKVAGTQHGFFKRDGISEEEIAVQIREARPDVLFVAFGIPMQEKFIARNIATMEVPVSLGVGGSFDVYSEKLRRAPVYIQRSGMEWLYRVWQEPWRWKRMSYVPRFMVLAIKVWLLGENKTPPRGAPQEKAPQDQALQ